MKKDEISSLLQRYLTASKKGTEPYFDADEIDAILDSFEEKEDYTHYEPLLKLGLRLHPDNSDLKVRQCKFLLFNEEPQQALDLLESLAGRNDQDTDMIRLECYCTLGQYPKAVGYLEKLIAGNCEYTEELFEFMAPLLSDLEMTDEAKELIARGMQLFPENSILTDELCYIYEIEGNYEAAIRICNTMIDKEPYSYDYWFMLGRLYSMANDFDNAIDAFDFALTCDDSDTDLKVLKAYCLFMNENYEKALEVYSEIAVDDNVAYSIKALRAECYIRMGDFEQAYYLIKEVISKEDVDDASVYIRFIRCCIETDRESEASQVLLKAAERFPDNVRILSLLALNYLEHGKDDMALQVTGKILQRLSTMDREGDDEDEYKELFGDDEHHPLSEETLNKIIKYYKQMLQLKAETDMATKGKYVPPEDLIRAYLNDKKNSN
jgi:tetratricopeptide (TPR) repeat protein